MKRVYLDNAATSFPKPPSVIQSVTHAMETLGGNPGRSSHALARAVSDAVFDTREAVATLFGGDAERVVFTLSATQALNIAVKGLIPKNSHVLISDIEHNAVLRPIAALKENGTDYSIYQSCGRFQGDIAPILASLEKNLRPNTSAIVACHRSNILPIELPLEAIGAFAKAHGLHFIVDASQSAGVCEIDLEKAGISALCAPFHKGLFGIRGGGFVLFGKSINASGIPPLVTGGSGSDSQSLTMPNELPDRLEAGTLPVEAILSLKAGIDFIHEVGIQNIRQKEETLTAYMRRRMLSLPSLRLYMANSTGGSAALFNLDGYSPSEVATILDQNGIALREGLHCAPLAHRLSGTLSRGALRASVGYFNTRDDVDYLIDTLKRIP
ncbi:MAG: aminotransferase class V-fold PLP-dependent enzyme, partial [Clostridia bacterium]|nr:aminotransferase class V-fold PLP-dependent enzyme [Clostridia bacterium]